MPSVAASKESAAIRLRGVRVHNLQSVDVDIPRGELIAVCGVSGSGKTSLALDTLYAEGQRRYIESFSAYTRQYLERLPKPEFDSIEGLPPALAVTRGGSNRGNRSTVGTASETLDYLRLFFANAASPYCPECNAPLVSHTPQTVANLIESIATGLKLMLLFSVEWEDVGHRASVLADLQQSGFVRLIGRSSVVQLGSDSRERLAEVLPEKGHAWVVVDRLRSGDPPTRSTESLENAFDHGLGRIALLIEGAPDSDPIAAIQSTAGCGATAFSIDEAAWSLFQLTTSLHCARCDTSLPTPEPRLFSFNSPLGACPLCEGFGDTIDLDMSLVVPDPRKSILEGAIAPWSTPAYEHNLDELIDVADNLNLPLDVAFNKLTKKQKRILREGDETLGFGGLDGFFRWLDTKKYKMHVRVFISRWKSYNTCSACEGRRLNPEALSFRVEQRNIADLCEMQIDDLVQFLSNLTLSDRELAVSQEPLQQVLARLGYLQSVGLGYLQLDRTIRSLSGGEAQRTALTAALGSTLVNMLYVLDEPSVGLHPHDVKQLAHAIQELTQRGNTVVMVEHEDALIQNADRLIEIGPAAGAHGGKVVFAGTTEEILESGTLTGEYLSGTRSIPVPSRRRRISKSITIKGCTGNNLRSIDVDFPLGLLCVVTGVSGSGKSSLVQDTLYGAITKKSSAKNKPMLPFKSISGTRQIEDCVLVDQSPVSRSPRSNPVTYVKAFEEIRGVFAQSLDAKTRNMTAGHFSFNSDLGRCPNCKGDGVLQVDMQFLADIQMTCPTCHGKRYRSEILTVKYRDQSIADVLALTVSEAMDFFRGEKRLKQKLKVLSDVGLDYLQLGQSATTLSSGEAQRLKLAGILASASSKNTLFIVDEPTTGLHFHDVKRLLSCFSALLDAGHSLIVVEHNLGLMAAADYIIDLGPGAAENGGRVIASGTPEQIAANSESVTGSFLKKLLKN